jgi:hypothetical protein
MTIILEINGQIVVNVDYDNHKKLKRKIESIKNLYSYALKRNDWCIYTLQESRMNHVTFIDQEHIEPQLKTA